MNISGISRNTLLGKILRYFLGFIPPGTIMPVLQGRLRGKKWIVGSGDHGCWLGSYEYKKRILFETIVREGSTVFDLGAHAGFYSLLASILAGPQGMVFSFEPNPRNLFYLKRHIQLNRIINISVVEAAVSDHDGYAYFSDAGPTSLTGRLTPEGKSLVKTVTLDKLCSEKEIPIPDYIKIDVEGAEMLVLSGAKSILSNYHPTLFLSTHSEAIHHQCCDFLKSLGYELKPIATIIDELLCYKG
jgi:FkbM family methyltransferase